MPITSEDALIEAMRVEFAGMHFKWNTPLPAGPIVLPREERDSLERGCIEVLQLLHRASLQFGSDFESRHRALGMDEQLIPHYGDTDIEERFATIVARPDVVRTPTGWKFFEFNVSTAIGGPSFVHVFNDLWRSIGYKEAPGNIDLGSPVLDRGKLFHSIATEMGTATKVAVLGHAGDIRLPTLRHYDIQVGGLQAAGLDATYIDMSEPHVSETLANKGISLAIQCCTPQDWIDKGRSILPIQEIRDSGILLLSPQSSDLVANKRTLAAVSTGEPWMSSSDREVAERWIPWTREIKDSRISYQGQWGSLIELIIGNKNQFVLKRSDGNSGRDVVIGHVTSPAAWEIAVNRATNLGTWIVQEYVKPDRFDVEVIYPDTREAQMINVPVLFGPFIIDNHLSGCFGRFDCTPNDGMISLSQPGGQMNSVGFVS